jgi:cation transport ATPase
MTAQDIHKAIRPFLIAISASGLAGGLIAQFLGPPGWAPWIWGVATLPVLAALAVEIASSLRRGDVGLDIVAALSMTAALIFGEYLAAAVVSLMYAGGQYLEAFAEGRARREMTALLSRMPRTAMRHRDGGLEEVAIEAIAVGDRLLIRRGDIAPVDGTVAKGVAVLDESALTGESLPVRRKSRQSVMSGSTNVGDAFDLTARRRAAESA